MPADAPKRPPGRPMGAKREEELTTQAQRNYMFTGISVADMEILFRMDRRTILGRISGHVVSVGKRGKADLYLIREVAPYLVVPVMGVEEYLRNARQGDLPATLQKDYWNGRRARQAALEAEGSLWQTDKVLGVMSKVFKAVRTSLLLLPDDLDRSHPMSEDQRQHVTQGVYATLKKVGDELRKDFGGKGDFSTLPGSDAEEEERVDREPDDELPADEGDEDDLFDLELPAEPGYDDTFD